MKNKNNSKNKKTNIIIIMSMIILFISILTLLNLNNENNSTKYNYKNLKILKYYPYEYKFPTIMHLSNNEKKEIIKLLDNETFKENKNPTDCSAVLAYEIKFDNYTLNINTECSTNTLKKDGKSKKLVIVSDKLINYVKKIDKKREKN